VKDPRPAQISRAIPRSAINLDFALSRATGLPSGCPVVAPAFAFALATVFAFALAFAPAFVFEVSS
jgi:hypothetical protein